MNLLHVVQYSGGLSSWATAKRVAERHGVDRLGAVRHEAAGILPRLYWVAEGRTPWEVFRDVRYVGNTRVDPCSRVLKRELLDRWMTVNCDPSEVTSYFGLDWDEPSRIKGVAAAFAGRWRVAFPMAEPPRLAHFHLVDLARSRGIEPPRLYARQFSHNNCAGACVKAGQVMWRRLLETDPARYAYEEAEEESVREMLGKDVSILKDRRGGGKPRTLTLRQFRESIRSDPSLFDPCDFGACSCFSKESDDGAA